jgi:transposase
MTYIRKVKTASGATAVQIVTKQQGKIIRLKHIGSAHSKTELEMLLSVAHKQIQGEQLALFTNDPNPTQMTIKRTFSALLWNLLKKQYDQLGFSGIDDEVFESLCIARIVEPTSKIDSLRILEDLGAEKWNRGKLYRTLDRASGQDYRKVITQACFDHIHGESLSLVLYDVTSLYFEVQKEDEYRKPGLSKERRLEPQIIIGLLVDKNGFPLGLQSFEGNKAETRTILPVIQAFQAEHNLKKVTVVADAAMLSTSNLDELTKAGYTYIVGSRLNKVPYEIAEFSGSKALQDQQIVVSEEKNYRIVYQYREKRAALDIRNIEKQIAKAEKAIAGQIKINRTKFLSIEADKKYLNLELIEKARALAGIKGYVTNLGIPDKEVIACYHQLFQVETSFRMMKSDLKARPIYHQKRSAIEAHLTIVFAALAISRNIERQTGVSIKQFIKTIRPLRSAEVKIKNELVLIEPEIPKSIQNMLKKLSSGH